MQKHVIVGIHITDRLTHAVKVQEIFTRFGSLIKTRLGLHEVGTRTSSPNGVVLLELLDKDAEVKKFVSAMRKIEGVEVKTIVFDHS